MTAIRETFEESGLLLATSLGTAPHDQTLDSARKAIHAGKLAFTSFLERHHFQPSMDKLLPFTQWITPATVPR
jgi:hypothetical protein